MAVAYELRTLELPRVKGPALAAFARILEGPLGGLVMGRLLSDAGVTDFRALRLEDTPAPLPLWRVREAAPPGARAEVPAASPGETPLCTVADIAAAYRAGAATPESVAARSLAAIRSADAGTAPLAAFIAIDEDDVMAQAREASRRLAAGAPLGPLDGVPVAIKDEIDVRGYPTTVGTRFLGDRPAAADSEVAARLRAAGAVLLGKTNMHEIGIDPSGLNVHHGQVRNPHDRSRDTGGSSSGSAAAVAAGICPVAIGADGGGSIRIPAALCGVYGLKPTYGRVSERGAFPLAWSVGHLGPIGASAGCLAAVYAAIAGPDPGDAASQIGPAPELEGWDRRGLEGIKVGVYERWFDHAAPGVAETARASLAHLEDAGAERVAIEVPELDEMRVAHAVTILAEMATSMANQRQHLREHGAGVRVSLALARSLTAVDYVRAQQVRARAMAAFAALFEEVDLVATPATALVAPPITDGGRFGYSDLGTTTELMRYIVPGNLAGLPGVVAPVGRGEDGMPVGLQLMSAPWRESLLLRAAGVLERALPAPRSPGYARLI